jgi:DNA-directed RNA polymerase subunit RPC12/RpoP
MYIKELACPRCDSKVVVDGALWEIGTVRLRCPRCLHRFLPEGSPCSRTVGSVANASVPVTIWEDETIQ